MKKIKLAGREVYGGNPKVSLCHLSPTDVTSVPPREPPPAHGFSAASGDGATITSPVSGVPSAPCSSQRSCASRQTARILGQDRS